jgi:hypothetical protein
VLEILPRLRLYTGEEFLRLLRHYISPSDTALNLRTGAIWWGSCGRSPTWIKYEAMIYVTPSTTRPDIVSPRATSTS